MTTPRCERYKAERDRRAPAATDVTVGFTDAPARHRVIWSSKTRWTRSLLEVIRLSSPWQWMRELQGLRQPTMSQSAPAILHPTLPERPMLSCCHEVHALLAHGRRAPLARTILAAAARTCLWAIDAHAPIARHQTHARAEQLANFKTGSQIADEACHALLDLTQLVGSHSCISALHVKRSEVLCHVSHLAGEFIFEEPSILRVWLRVTGIRPVRTQMPSLGREIGARGPIPFSYETCARLATHVGVKTTVPSSALRKLHMVGESVQPAVKKIGQDHADLWLPGMATVPEAAAVHRKPVVIDARDRAWPTRELVEHREGLNTGGPKNPSATRSI